MNTRYVLIAFVSYVLLTTLLFFSLQGAGQVTFTRYVRTLYYAGLVLGVIGLVLTIQSKDLQDTGYILQLHNREKDALLTGINEKIMNYYPQSERLYLEMNAFNPSMKKLQTQSLQMQSTPMSDSRHQLIVENVLATYIFRRMEELLLVEKMTSNHTQTPFLDKTLQRIFKEWLRSPILKRFWQSNQMQFSSMLRKYVDDVYFNLESHTLCS